MMSERVQSFDATVQRALSELEDIIRQHYPSSRFEVRRGHDDPESIHLMAIVDLEDTDPVFDLVLERMMEIQIEDELPIYVIPVRPPERVQTMREATLRPPVTDFSASAHQQ